ncbi:cyclopropane fatty acyl phospholipid synthase [archaeon]|jgi:cyclopropane-fatty-acyl-phospholipid synthase|nr:cyclopropane fatty acyl phospholipid synthase [archaeon]
MGSSKLKQKTQEILNLAKVKLNGKNPWDIQVHNEKFYQRVLAEGSLGLGESYMDGWWDCEELDQLFYRISKADLANKVKGRHFILDYLKARIINLQKGKKAFEVGRKHYDIGNDLYRQMLDKRMVYTCGYWKNANNLDSAQEAKLDLVCKKIGLKKGMKVLDIGCGWGSFAKFAAEKYGAKVVGITISKEQVEMGNKLCKGLPVEIRLQDYREINEKFDCIVSLGMFEHVGYKNYKEYMKVVNKCLKDEGLFLLHTIGGNKSVKSTDPWISKYIFTNSMLPSAKQITSASEGLFVLEDWHSFGTDYDKTLMEWHKNFTKNWDKIKDNYDTRFKRMWDYYLLCCAASFRANQNQLWQIVFSKKGIEKGYNSIR